MRIKTTYSCFLAAVLGAGAHAQRLLQDNDSPTAAPLTETAPPDAAGPPTTAPLPQPVAPPPTNVPSAFVAPAPTSPPTNLPTGITSTYSYASVGCYVDDAHDRVLTGSSVKGVEAMTTEVRWSLRSTRMDWNT